MLQRPEIDVLSSYAVGYFYSVFLGHWLIRAVIHELHEKFNTGPADFLTHTGGMVERAIYTTSWLLQVPEFIPAWLVFKVAGQWGRWMKEDEGRAVYVVFLIGSGLSLFYAVTGALMIQWLIRKQFYLGICLPVLVIIATLALLLAAKRAKADKATGSIRFWCP